MFDEFKHTWLDHLKSRGKMKNSCSELGHMVRKSYGEGLSDSQVIAVLASASRYWSNKGCVYLGLKSEVFYLHRKRSNRSHSTRI
jgi:hypothetical protein